MSLAELKSSIWGRYLNLNQSVFKYLHATSLYFGILRKSPLSQKSPSVMRTCTCGFKDRKFPCVSIALRKLSLATGCQVWDPAPSSRPHLTDCIAPGIPSDFKVVCMKVFRERQVGRIPEQCAKRTARAQP